jgi:hypothetical protein
MNNKTSEQVGKTKKCPSGHISKVTRWIQSHTIQLLGETKKKEKVQITKPKAHTTNRSSLVCQSLRPKGLTGDDEIGLPGARAATVSELEKHKNSVQSVKRRSKRHAFKINQT